ncbi:MAG: FAD-binding oxidoreductase [Methylococcaceae bacterium]|jgi:decaprenylphospho-beta-D-ribofuranose 2-oxidase
MRPSLLNNQEPTRLTKSPQTGCAFVSFDGGTKANSRLEQPDRYRYWNAASMLRPGISRGAGLSYAAASFIDTGLSVSHANFNRILGFDAKSRIVEVEAGITLYALYRFLSQHNLYLPVQPGHGRITVGGCIAADVHGKNQARDGTFINQVESLSLFHPSHGMLELSRESEPELFRLSCGGYGLTGNIIRAKLRASPIPASLIQLSAVKFEEVQQGLQQLGEQAQNADFTYTWHDMASAGKKFGSGYLYIANFVDDGVGRMPQPADTEAPELTSKTRSAWPLGLLNAYSVHLLNTIYRYQQKPILAGKLITLEQALFPVHKAQLYFKLFGRRGFHEYQAILPQDGLNEYLNMIEKYIRGEGLAISLASAKAFGGKPELLRFTGKGICFALNFPRTRSVEKLMPVLDNCLITLGGRPNLIKDSRLPRAVLDACYPGAEEFRSILTNFDPKRLYRSELSTRLDL